MTEVPSPTLSALPPAAASDQSPPVGSVERASERAPRQLRGAVGWGTCLALALGLHAAGAAALFARWQAEPNEVAGAPIVLVELAPVTAAPAAVLTEVAPGPRQAQDQPGTSTDKSVQKAEPTPDQPVDKAETNPPEPMQKVVALPPALAPESELVPQPLPKPAEKRGEKSEKKKKKGHVTLATAPSVSEHRAERISAPAPGAPVHANALPTWKSALVAQLERNKRYPPEAQARREHGVAELAFSVDRAGGVHRARILRSSGSSLLDAATLDLLRRAAPLPPPPPEVAGAQIAIVVPVRYNAR